MYHPIHTGSWRFFNKQTDQREKSIRSLSLAQARRLALQAQGFGGKPQAQQPKWRTLRLALERMSVLQIDAINTVIRSHYMPLFSRLGSYDRALLDTKLFDHRHQRAEQRAFYEYWGHECSFLPVDLYPLFQWRREDAMRGKGIYKQLYQLARDQPALVNRVKNSVAQVGRLSYSDLDSDARGPGMWEWSHTKQALEYLFWSGELASAGRQGFRRLYTLPEHAIPADLLQQDNRHRGDDLMALLEISAGALGIATETDLRDYFRLGAAESKMAVASLVEAGDLLPVKVESWAQCAYMLPGTKVPRSISASTLLTPFDPIVWCRDRAERLFGFHYRIEIYVPANKRVFGYWVMPFLFGDQLLARVDLKADRQTGVLHVKGAWSEARSNPDARPRDIAQALFQALTELAQWLDLGDIVIAREGDLATELSACYEAI